MLNFSINQQSFGQLAVFKKQIAQCKERLYVTKVHFLRPYCVAYLDQLLLWENKKRKLHVQSTYQETNQYLKQVGFGFIHPTSKGCKSFPQKEIIRIKRFGGSSNEMEEPVVKWIKNDLLPHMPSLDGKLRKKIVTNIWEIVNNSLTHGEGEFGVSACGQFYPQMGYFEVAFYDAGHGIPKLTRDFLKGGAPASDSGCITWAIQEGHSTRPIGESAGMGLHLLREFLKLNHGTFQIASGVGYYADNEGVPPASELRNSIEGTLVNLRIIYDNYTYQLIKGEHNENN